MIPHNFPIYLPTTEPALPDFPRPFLSFFVTTLPLGGIRHLPFLYRSNTTTTTAATTTTTLDLITFLVILKKKELTLDYL